VTTSGHVQRAEGLGWPTPWSMPTVTALRTLKNPRGAQANDAGLRGGVAARRPVTVSARHRWVV